jgi:hypothetical protein
MTSEVSTFAYDKAACESFLHQLEVAKQDPSKGHHTCIVARLWNLICKRKHFNCVSVYLVLT